MTKSHSNENKNAKHAKEHQAADAESAQAPAPQEDRASESGEARVEDLAAEVERLKDQMLRAMAEAENTRRRLSKELDETRKFAVSHFAKEMLVVADNFRRALEAIPKDHAGNDTLKQLIAGVEATERQLLASFEKFGIKKLNPMGQPFDPHFHRVMMEVDDAAHPAGTVVQVLQEGYAIHDRLLREALVAVSKGGPAVHQVDTQA
jgi:molecular chaperone GrpE